MCSGVCRDIINLDVSTMIAWVSELTHGGHVCGFENRFLQEQARQEQKERLWPLLESATKGKKIVACMTALENFQEIVKISGGPLEKERAEELIDGITIVPDIVSGRVSSLRETAAVKAKAKIIFGTGDSLKAVTLTSNRKFIQAAKQQGVVVSALLHPPRSLAELCKEPHKPNIIGCVIPKECILTN